MQYKNKRTVLIYILVFLLVSLTGMLLSDRPFFSNFSRIFYGAVIVVWAMTVLRRIIEPTLRRLLIMSAILLLMLILFQALRYQFEQGDITVHHLMWYWYYFPICFIPVMALKIALRCGRSENESISRLWSLLYIPAGVLTVLMLTNDRHNLAFSFTDPVLSGYDVYTPRIIYYLIIIWVSGLIMAAVTMVLVRFAGRVLRKDSWAYCCVLGCSLYFLITDYFDVAPVINGVKFLNQVEIFSIFIVCGWEACIQTCLLPSNTGYRYFFENSGMIARITDNKGRVCIASKGEESDWSRLKEDYHFLGRPVWGGMLSYAEDITAITRSTKELKDISARLLEENSIQEAENNLKKESVRVAVMNRLYDDITEFSSEKKEEIEKLLNETGDEETFLRNLKKACILASYIKRRGNLYLLGEENSEYDFNDLFLSFKESLDYFSLGGIKTLLSAGSKDPMEKSAVFSAYDCLQAILEYLAGKTGSMLVNLSSKDRLEVRFMFDLESDHEKQAGEVLSIAGRFCQNCDISVEEGSTVVLTLVFENPEIGAEGKTAREGRWHYAAV